MDGNKPGYARPLLGGESELTASGLRTGGGGVMNRTPVAGAGAAYTALPDASAATTLAPPPRYTNFAIAESPIDFGFEHHIDFDRGTVRMETGQPTLDLSSLQAPLSVGAKLCSVLGITLTAATGVGLIYLTAKATLVQRTEIALAVAINGSTRVLGPGFHLVETVFTSIRRAPLSSEYIQHGTVTIVRVKPGFVGLGTHNSNPLILLPGWHLFNDPLFVFDRQVTMTEPHINVGTVHLVIVANGRVGLCMVDSTAHFLEPGRHHINNPRFIFSGFKDSTEEHITIGSKHRIIIPAGRLGRAWIAGEPNFLEPGRVYNIDAPNFRYDGSVSVIEPIISHGRLKWVTVKQGFWGISYDDGVLTILEPGRHLLSKASHFLAGFLSSGQQVLPISQVVSMTSDNVGIQFDAAISLRVVDPKKAVTMLSTNEGFTFNPRSINDTIVSKAKLALTIIIGNNRLNNTFRSTARVRAVGRLPGTFDVEAKLDEQPAVLPPLGPGDAGAGTGLISATTAPASHVYASEDPSSGPSDDSFKQHIHDVFMHSFSEQMLRDCGVQVIDMSIEDVTITNPDLARAMAQGAVARTELIKAQIEQEVTKTRAIAEQAAEVTRAEGKARALTIQASAQSEATAIQSAADAKRIAMIAEAEAARIAKLDSTLGAASSVMQQRELVRAAGEVLKESSSSVLLASSTADITSLLAGQAAARTIARTA